MSGTCSAVLPRLTREIWGRYGGDMGEIWGGTCSAVLPRLTSTRSSRKRSPKTHLVRGRGEGQGCGVRVRVRVSG